MHRDIIGGAGTYTALGGRLLSPAALSRRIGWIVDAGADFPPALLALITSWQTSALLRQRPNNEATTRGWNGYGAHDRRDFRYTTPKRRLTADDLPAESLLRARSFHLICGAGRCVELVQRTRERREAELRGVVDDGAEPPYFVWEPVPDMCTAAELPAVREALKVVDVVSPNHQELAALFATRSGGDGHDDDGRLDPAEVEAQAAELVAGTGDSERAPTSVVVRCGAAGCFVLAGHQKAQVRAWLPAWHSPANGGDPSRVVDPTGGGNGFLGGMAVGLVRSDGDVLEAARWGSIAASFCIEQVGVPNLTRTDDGQELWNGVGVSERLEEFKRRADGTSVAS